MVHNDFEAVENKKGWPEGHAMVHRQLTIPVIRNQQVVAVCGVGNKVFEYDQLDLENAQLLADLIWELAESIVTREQLTESEKQLRGLVENAPYGIYRTTADGVILMANPYLLKMLEFDSTDELYKRNLQAEGIFDKHHRELFLSKLMREGVVQNMESRWVTKSGKSIVVSESARLVKNNKGEVLYFEGMVENLSHLKRLTLSLKKK